MKKLSGISLFFYDRKRIPWQIPSAEQKGAAQCGKDRKKQTDLRHFRLLEALYCHIPGQKRRTDIVTEGKQVFSFGRRNFPFISQVRAGFCPYWKATEKSTDHRKRSIFRNAKKRLQNRRKGMVDQGNALCADHKTGYKKKRKEHRKHLPIPEQQSVCGTCCNGFRGKKHQKEKSDQKKHRQFFCFHRVYLPYSFAIVYEKTQTDIPGHMCIEEIQCE